VVILYVIVGLTQGIETRIIKEIEWIETTVLLKFSIKVNIIKSNSFIEFFFKKNLLLTKLSQNEILLKYHAT